MAVPRGHDDPKFRKVSAKPGDVYTDPAVGLSFIGRSA